MAINSGKTFHEAYNNMNEYSIEQELSEIFKSDNPNASLEAFSDEKLNKCLQYVRSKTLKSEIVANNETIKNSYPDIKDMINTFIELANKFEDSKTILSLIDVQSINCKTTLFRLIEIIRSEIDRPVEKLNAYFSTKKSGARENDPLVIKLKKEWKKLSPKFFPVLDNEETN